MSRLSRSHGMGAQLLVFLLISILFGGGGVNAAWQNLLVQLAGLALLAINFAAVRRFALQAPHTLRVLAICLLAVPLIQLIPLPPSIWKQLPGRDLLITSLELVGHEDDFRPITVSVARTSLSLIGLIPLMAALVVGYSFQRESRDRLLQLLVVMGWVQLAFGAISLATGANTTLFESDHASGMLRGLFANKNSTGLFLDVALIGAMGLLFAKAGARHSWGYAAWVSVIIFPVAIILTVSRSAMVLLAVVAVAGLGLAFVRAARKTEPGGISAGRLKALIGGVVLACTIGGLVVTAGMGQGRIERSLVRFADLQDGRAGIWADALTSASHFWPVGAGMGTFDEVFQVDESLERVRAGRAGRAHNEYLEIAIETGVIGIGAILYFAALHLIACIKAIRHRNAIYAVAAFAGLLCIAAQSVLDYPMRSAAMLPVAGLLLALFWGAVPDRNIVRRPLTNTDQDSARRPTLRTLP